MARLPAIEMTKYSDKQLLSGALLGALSFWSICLTLDIGQFDAAYALSQWRWLLLVCLIMPVLEEVVFRGFVQGALLARTWPRASYFDVSRANIITSSLFAASHVLGDLSWPAVAVFIPSIYLGVVREQTKSLGYCIGIHGFWNFGWFVLISPA